MGRTGVPMTAEAVALALAVHDKTRLAGWHPYDGRIKDESFRLRIELGVPVQVVEPAVVQIVGREQPAVAMQLMHGRRKRLLPWEHPCLLRRQIALAQIARGARRHDIFPRGVAAFAARNDVIEGEVVARETPP